MFKSFQMRLYITASVLSLLMTVFMLSYHQPVNPDAIAVYLKAAHTFYTSGFKQAITVSHWPFYSILISIVSHSIHLSYEYSARLIDAFFDVGVVLLFIRWVKELGGSRCTQILALFMILFFPQFAHARIEIVRDHAYLFFSLLSFVLFVRYYRTPTIGWSIAWGSSIILATLFRIEGILFVFFLPFIFLFKPHARWTHKVMLWGKAYIVHILCALLLLLGVIIILYYHEQPLDYFGRLFEIKDRFAHQLQDIWIELQNNAGFVRQYILPKFNQSQAMTFIVGGLSSLLCVDFFSHLTIPYALLACYAFFSKQVIVAEWPVQITWRMTIVLNFLIISSFLCSAFFLSNRYLALLNLLLLLGAVFSIESIYYDWKFGRGYVTGSRWLFPGIVISTLLIMIVALGHFGPSKTYILKASQWSKQNISLASRVCTNNIQIQYTLDRENVVLRVDDQATAPVFLKTCDYALIQIDHKIVQSGRDFKQPRFANIINLFSNRRGDRVIVLKIMR